MGQSTLTEKLIKNAGAIVAGKYRKMTIADLTDEARMAELTDTLNEITEGVETGIVNWQVRHSERVLVAF